MGDRAGGSGCRRDSAAFSMPRTPSLPCRVWGGLKEWENKDEVGSDTGDVMRRIFFSLHCLVLLPRVQAVNAQGPPSSGDVEPDAINKNTVDEKEIFVPRD